MLRGSAPPRLALFAALLALSRGGAAAESRPAVARAGGGQAALAVGFDPAGQLRARVCGPGQCTLDGAAPLAVPEDIARRATGARLTIAPLGLGRKAIVVEVPDPSGASPWAVIVAAPLAGTEPLVPFNGQTGWKEGLEGEREGSGVLVRPEGVYVGVVREGSDLCGRPALLAPKALDPKTLTLKPAKLQRLTEEEQSAAPELAAMLLPDAEPAGPRLLSPAWATSAMEGGPATALLDGKAETAWAEDRGGVGRGEFAVLRAPREVPIAAFDVAVPVAGGSALPPHDFWIATDAKLFRVKLPPAVAPGARYRVTAPEPVRTGCVALVLEGRQGTEREPAVGLAELSARPALPGSPAELVRLLPGGGPDSEAAGAVLGSLGAEGFAAVRDAFSGLDEGGRRVALDVLDSAPCDVALPAYVSVLVAGSDAERRHVDRALPRCQTDVGAAVRAALQKGKRKERILLAEELVRVAPGAAVEELVPRLAVKDAAERRAYRAALYRAAESREARAALASRFEAAEPNDKLTLELLRALDGALPSIGPAAERALGRLAASNARFETRFLLLEPASVLAVRDGPSRAFLRSVLTRDPSEHVRAEAARRIPLPSVFAAELSHLLDDPGVRVREAAALALGKGRIEAAGPALVVRLGEDPWPLVRAASARALGLLGKAAELDRALGDALVVDESPMVRIAALDGLGARRALPEAERVRERLEDTDELPEVRARAATALGAMCDRSSLAVLEALARKLARPASQADAVVGAGAAQALGMLSPKEAAIRLAPLRAKGVPAAVRRVAEDAAKGPGRCGS